MVTTIGIDPQEATHTAVAIDESETVLGEMTIPADRYQTARLMDWAHKLNGGHRVWAIEAAGGLGSLLSRQLVARDEEVIDVPPGCRPHGFGCCHRASPTRTTRMMPVR